VSAGTSDAREKDRNDDVQRSKRANGEKRFINRTTVKKKKKKAAKGSNGSQCLPILYTRAPGVGILFRYSGRSYNSARVRGFFCNRGEPVTDYTCRYNGLCKKGQVRPRPAEFQRSSSRQFSNFETKTNSK